MGTYDPMCPETDARVTFKQERVQHWIGVGAQPSEKVAVLIKKYGVGGTHLAQQEAALARLALRKDYKPAEAPSPKKKTKAEKPAAEAKADDATKDDAKKDDAKPEDAASTDGAANAEAAKE